MVKVRKRLHLFSYYVKFLSLLNIWLYCHFKFSVSGLKLLLSGGHFQLNIMLTKEHGLLRHGNNKFCFKETLVCLDFSHI